ncbi:MAG: hypothetical protein JW730_08005 [Anaerolineales bacterium]|nr:hypothetical protein [Anaerolineales bacterium]
MNVFLMYPDRDYDAKQSIPPNAEALTEDLELNILFNAMTRGDDFLFDAARQSILSGLDSPDFIRYRQAILQDCLTHPEVIRQIYRIPIQSIENKRRHWMGIFSRYPSSVLHGGRELLTMFVGLLKTLKQIADEHAADFESEGFKRFFSMIQQELSDDYFALVESHLKTLQFRDGVLVSAELGTGNEGANYVLRKSNHEGQSLVKRVLTRKSPSYSYRLDPRDDHGAVALGQLRDKGINLVANAVGQSADHIDNFLNVLRLELAFYIGCLNLAEQLAQFGGAITLPEPSPSNERQLTCTGLYDVCLALTMKKKVMGNEVHADGKDIVFITGANQGGKSTFLRSIGLAQLMMQCGMFVPAETFSANVCTGLFTHYKREEDTTMKSGKFDEELGRMSAIIDHIRPDTMVLFNESFAATNEREGSEIARQIVRALLDKHVKVYYVTHLYELASGFYNQQMENAIFLRADRQRSFKLAEAEPLRTSFGTDLYNKIFRAES